MRVSNRVKMLCTAVCITMGCQEKSADLQGGGGPDSVAENERLKRQIVDKGFNPDSVTDMGDFFLVEGDIAFDKEDLRKTSMGKISARRRDELVNQSRIRKVTVRIDPSVPRTGGEDWWQATWDAIAQWNAVVPTSINFEYTTASTSDIVVTDAAGALTGNTLADGKFPSDGAPGNRIRINLGGFLNFDYKAAVIAHELGHTIGFCHTNSSNGHHIEQTPPDDPASVMRQGNQEIRTITEFDQLAAAALYPAYDQIGGAWWDRAVAMTSLGSSLYILHSAQLYQVNPTTGDFTPRGGSWWDRALAISAVNSSLYILHDARIYEMNPETSVFTPIGGRVWDHATGMTALGSSLYVVHRAQLFQVDPLTGSYTPKGGAVWDNLTSIAALGSKLYIIHRCTLYEVDPNTGEFSQRGNPVYPVLPVKMASVGPRLYIMENSRLNRVDPSGFYIHGQEPLWADTKAMAGLGEYLYIIQGSRLFKVLRHEV